MQAKGKTKKLGYPSLHRDHGLDFMPHIVAENLALEGEFHESGIKDKMKLEQRSTMRTLG